MHYNIMKVERLWQEKLAVFRAEKEKELIEVQKAREKE